MAIGSRSGSRSEGNGPGKPDYGVDAPGVVRGLFLGGVGCLLFALLLPAQLHLGSVVVMTRSFLWPAGFLLAEWALFMVYVKYGKFRHRDFMLGMHRWRGDERVLDVGCGRGLLLAGAAKRLQALDGDGTAIGIDVWSNVDMGGNSEAATLRNLTMEGIAQRCTLVSEPAQEMQFAADSFDVVVSNLCLHNIPQKAQRREAVLQIVRVLRPGGVALISDYRRTGEYTAELRSLGLPTETRWGSWLTTFPPLRVVIARKPGANLASAVSASEMGTGIG